ncbi:MAG: parallel beta-helix repeat protein, partial [Phycisphaerales bacterium]
MPNETTGRANEQTRAGGRVGLSVLLLAVAAGAGLAQRDLPTVTVTRDDTRLTESCRVVIPKGAVIADLNGNGVIHIAADGITVEFADGTELVGMAGLDEWEATGTGAYDRLTGIGVRIEGVRGVTLRGARVRGFHDGIVAVDAPGLTIEDAVLTDLYQASLRSTPAAEDSADWISPHANDGGEWLANYGAALSVKDSDGVTVRRVKVRRSQNGIVLDRVNNGVVYDNDCSFLSGWGIAMWRSSGNTISRNALDYCVRGHVEGVYNRGQDSAGLLMFEQCNDNKILENSATHSGDGIFAFAGNEAIGQNPPIGEIDYLDAGVNSNLFAGNNLSYAAAHGLELTFSENNVVAGNRFVGNAICGIWGGYSSAMRVHGNVFSENGGMAYGLERGGINAEHASGWLIDENEFINNRCAIQFWIDNDESTLRLPGVRLGYRGVDGNTVTRNRIVMNAQHPFGDGAELIGLQVRRDVSNVNERSRPFGTNWLIENEFDDEVGRTIVNDQAEFVTPDRPIEDLVWFTEIPEPTVLGTATPVADSMAYGDRSSIIMGRWRAWDFESPMFREAHRSSGSRRYELFVPEGFAGQVRVETLAGPEVRIERAQSAGPLEPYRITVESGDDAPVTASAFTVHAGEG